MKVSFGLLLVVLLASLTSATSTTPTRVDTKDLTQYYVYKSTKTGRMEVTDRWSFNACATAWYNNSAADLGWDFFQTTAYSRADATTDRWFCAGYLEGYLTHEMMSRYNWDSMAAGLAAEERAWAWEQRQFLEKMSTKYGDKERSGDDYSAFWDRAGRILEQMQGIAEGYNARTKSNISDFDVFVANLGPEMGDIQIAINVQKKHRHAPHSYGSLHEVIEQVSPLPDFPNARNPKNRNSHCSALIKVLPADLYMSHDTWSGFEGMTSRIYKVYMDGPSGRAVTLSSYPATVASGDDWYQISEADKVFLGVQETTNGVYNTTLYLVMSPKSVPEFMRVMIPNYYATTGDEWTEMFSRYNSGTYNNQWMVVDFNQFTPSTSNKPGTVGNGTLWVAEQLPGYVTRSDETEILRSTGYWASYNIPFFKDIFDLSGNAEMEANWGSFYSYTKYARPEIFKRNHTDVTDVASMMHMMRYNDYKVDPFSLMPNCTGATNGVCSPKHSSMLSIASRGDLMTVYNTTAENTAHYGNNFYMMAQGCFGAIDSKIATWSNRKSLTSYIVNGPTNDQQPSFSWGKGPCPKAPKGGPTTYDFPWVSFNIEKHL